MPWLITAQAHASIRTILESHLGQSALDVQAMREGTGPCGDAVEVEQMQIVDGIAHIPIGGVIGQKLSGFEKGSGAVDVNDIADEIGQAEKDPNVSTILFDIDSPGGMVSGTPELASKIRSITKPKYAFSAGQIASAAYWLASSTDGIFATQSADIGSIGVYVPWVDVSKALDNEGVKVELFKAGKFKGMGFPGVPLTNEQRQHLQSRVDEIYAMFTGHVQSMRGMIDNETMQGQTFLANDAARLGLIDGVVDSKEEAISLIVDSKIKA